MHCLVMVVAWKSIDSRKKQTNAPRATDYDICRCPHHASTVDAMAEEEEKAYFFRSSFFAVDVHLFV